MFCNFQYYKYGNIFCILQDRCHFQNWLSKKKKKKKKRKKERKKEKKR